MDVSKISVDSDLLSQELVPFFLRGWGVGLAFGLGTSMMGSPAAVRSSFHFSHCGPPPMSMTLCMIVDDHLLSTSTAFVEPSPEQTGVNYECRPMVDSTYEVRELAQASNCHSWSSEACSPLYLASDSHTVSGAIRLGRNAYQMSQDVLQCNDIIIHTLLPNGHF